MIGENYDVENALSIKAASRWVLRHRPDGQFDYAKYRYVDLRPERQVEGGWEWSLKSGIFETAQAARADALDTMSWLPGQL